MIFAMWSVAGENGEELDKVTNGDGLQRCITADTKWSQVQVMALHKLIFDFLEIYWNRDVPRCLLLDLEHPLTNKSSSLLHIQ